MPKVKGLILIDKWNHKVADNLDCDFEFELYKAVAHNIAYIEWFSNL